MLPLDKAIEIATQAHAGQLDKAGKPYISHPLAVMGLVNTETEKIVAVLHDVVEDTPVTLDDLKAQGFRDEVLTAIQAITKVDGEDYTAYLERVKANPIALKVKIADMTHNMDLSRIAEPTAEDHERLSKYQTILPELKAALDDSQNKIEGESGLIFDWLWSWLQPLPLWQKLLGIPVMVAIFFLIISLETLAELSLYELVVLPLDFIRELLSPIFPSLKEFSFQENFINLLNDYP